MSPRPRLPLGAHGDIVVTRQVPDGKLASGNVRWRAAADGEQAPLDADGRPRERWRARARYRDKRGRAVQIERYSDKSGNKAKTALQEVLTSATKEIYRPEAATKVSAITERWWKDFQSSGKVLPQTLDQYHNAIDKHLLPQFGNLQIGELDTATICDGLAEIASTARSRAQITRVLLKHVCTFAVRRGAIEKNPITGDVPTYNASGTGAKSISEDQYRDVRQAVIAWQTADHKGPERSTMVLDVLDFMTATGCRTGEALAVRWEDVHLGDDPTVTISGTIIEARKGTPVRRQAFTKTAAGFRTIHIGDTTVAMLMRRSGEEMLNDHGMVFPNAKGGYQAPGGFRFKLRAALKAAGLEGFYPYLMRKTGAKEIRDAVDIEAARAQLGHSSSAVTVKHYAGLVHDAPDVSDVMERYLSEASSSAVSE